MSPELIGLLEVSSVTTGSSNTIDALEEGPYPFFDRSQVIKRSNKFLFDTEAVIVPGEGMDFIPRYTSGKFDLHQRAYAVIPKDNIDGRYLYYAVLNNKRHFSQVATGSTVKSLRLKSFELMRIPFVDMELQKKISNILASFDYKIDRLGRINDNLEKMSGVLFQRHFLDGEEASFTAVANFQNGLAMQKYRPTDDNSLPVLKIKELGNGHCDELSDRCRADINPDVVVNNSDLVFSWSGSLMAKIWCGGVCGLNQHLFKVTSDQYPNWFIYEWLQVYMPHFVDIAADKATTMGHITRKHLDEAMILIPPSCVWDNYAPLMNAIFEMRVECMKEISKLQDVRDYLLPKLMNGDIDVSTLDLPTKYSFSTPNSEHGQDHQRGAESEADRKD